MICAKCKNELLQGTKFCGKCGTKVVVERKCSTCNTLLNPDEIFCTECGTQYDDGTNTEKSGQKALDETSQPSATKTESVCTNTIKGKIAVIDDDLYFTCQDKKYCGNYDNTLYSVSLKNGGKARVLFNQSNFFRTIITDNTSLRIRRLHAWKGKLYFGAEINADIGDEMLFGDNSYYINGIFSFCPKTNKIELVKNIGLFDAQVFFEKDRAYYLDNMSEDTGKRWIDALHGKYGDQNGKWKTWMSTEDCNTEGLYSWRKDDYENAQVMLTLDLTTAEALTTFMPLVARKEWRDNSNESGEIVTKWNSPIFYNGYIYTSVDGKSTYSLRFPVNNPEGYELLPLNTMIYNYENRTCLFAASNDVIILPHYDDILSAISQTTLRPVDGFQEHRFEWISPLWQVYGDNYLTISDGHNDNTKVFDIKNTKYLGNSDRCYCRSDMYDNVYYNNVTYALGSFYQEGECGEEYDGLALYGIPWDKMFKKDTNIDDFAQPLF